MSLEQLIVLAIFLLIALFNFVRQIRAQQRQRREASAEAPQEEPARVPRAELPPRVIVVPPAAERRGPPPRPLRAEPRREGPAPRPVPPTRPRRRPRRLFADRRDVRRGVVLLTVLGPCRGIEPPAEPTGDISTPSLPR